MNTWEDKKSFQGAQSGSNTLGRIALPGMYFCYYSHIQPQTSTGACQKNWADDWICVSKPQHFPDANFPGDDLSVQWTPTMQGLTAMWIRTPWVRNVPWGGGGGQWHYGGLWMTLALEWCEVKSEHLLCVNQLHELGPFSLPFYSSVDSSKQWTS